MTTANPNPFDDIFDVGKRNSSLNSVNLLVLCVVLLFAAVSAVPDESVKRFWDEAHKEEDPARRFTNLGRRSKRLWEEAHKEEEPARRFMNLGRRSKDYISTSRSLHELQSFKCMAQDANLADQLGLSLSLLRKAKNAD
ncbi:hypothetical protein Droror1_Dr00015998 [Drosera rotundifolia]